MAADESAGFNIFIRGFKFGTIGFSARENGSAYAVGARVEASGLIGALVRARYDAQAQGSLRGSTIVPRRYEEQARRGSRVTQSVMEYARGVPKAKVQTPPANSRPSDIDPAAQGGTLDPASAIWVALRDQDAATACQVDIPMYDGRYRARITISNPRPEGDNLICDGAYERVAGYSDEELAEGRRFPFTARYVPIAEGKVQLQQIQMSTLYGSARVDRR